MKTTRCYFSPGILHKMERCAMASMMLLVLTIDPTYAAFEETSVSARITAMGGIGAAIVDDVSAVYHNPAGLALVPQAQFIAQYSKLYVGLDDGSSLGNSFAGIAYPVQREHDMGTAGLGWLRLNLAGYYTEDTVILSYAKYGLLPKSSLGINVKYMRLNYGQDQYTQNALDENGNALGHPDSLFAQGTSKGVVDLDIGYQYFIGQNYRLGLVLANIMQPNIAIGSGDTAVVPLTWKMGLAHTGKNYTLTADTLMKNNNGSNDMKIAAAGERWFKSGLAVRGGFGFGSREFSQLSVGLGYKYQTMQFDYAMAYPLSGIKDTFGTHRASLMFKFGPVIRGSVESGELVNELTEERSKRVKAERELAAAQKELAQMKRDFNELLRKPSSKKIPVTPLQRSVLSSNAAGETKKAAPVVTSPAGVSLQSSVPVRTTDAKKRVQPAQQRNENEYTIEYAKYRRNALRLSLNQRIDRVKAMIENYKGLYPTLEAEQEYRVLVTEVQAQRKYYNDAMTYHKKMVNRGLSGKEQIAQLRRIIDKYKNKTDTSEAERAYAAMTGDLAVQQKNYDDSLNYFKKMASSGISIEEQIDLVQRILRKYENTAVNVSEAREQLQKLKDRK